MVFSNKFNSKKADPLVEAAKAAMELGQKRREAINAVNEEFGVYSRNAVVREQLAAYDARIEEVYKGMMAGNLTEGKKLADKDYDKDGKIESPKDEVWGSRFRAAKAAGKMEEGSQWRKPGREGKTWGTDSSEDREDGHETKFQLNKKGKISDGPNKDVLAHRKDPDKWYSKAQQKKHGVDLKSQIKNQIGKHTKPNLPEETDYSAPDRAAVTKDNKPSVSTTAPKADTSGPSAADKAGLAAKIGAMKEAKLDELTKPTAKTAMKAYHRAYDSDVRSGEGERSNRLYKWKQKHLPGKSARNQKSTGKADLPDVSNTEFHKAGYPGHVTKGGKLTKSASKETKADIKSRLGKHTKPKHLPEDALEEATRKHFVSHAADIAKISDQGERNKAASAAADTYARLNKRFDHAKFHKAAGSTAHEATKTVKESVLSAIRVKMEEQTYDLKYGPTAKPKTSAFGSAFAAARKAGQSNFSFGGKSFNTQVKGAPTAPKTSAVPSVPKPTPKAAADTSGQAKMDAMNKLGQTPAPTPAQTKQASDIVRDKGPSMTRQYSFPGSTVAPPKADVDTKTPKNPSSAADVSGASKMSAMDKLSSAPTPAPTPEVSKQASDIVRGKGPSMTRPGTPAPNLNEEVQVGANKYRIV